MSASLLLSDIVRWSVQIAAIVLIGVATPRLLRLRLPNVRLGFWQIVLLSCLLLPAIRSWKQSVLMGGVSISTTIVAIASPVAAAKQSALIPIALVLLTIIAAGVLVRLGFLMSGLLRLRRYRLESRPLAPAPSWAVEADLRVSEEINGPVTFGFRKPVILLPVRFLSLAEELRDAILCHEILHVRRRDWLCAAAEEIVRAVFWFHPAIWWLLREIQLVREQAVDQEAVEITRARDHYIDALLVIAGAPQSDLPPAPLFLRKRHLKQRVASILKEVRMSTAKSVCVLTACLTILAGACWLITGTIRLEAAPQVVEDSSGVSVDTRGADLLHREAVPYPAEAIAKGIQGTVAVSVRIDATGNVGDASVISGPDELRKAVLQSVLNWHFTPTGAANSTRVIDIAFTLPAKAAPSVRVTAAEPVFTGPTAPQGAVIRNIQVVGLSDQARVQLLATLPVHAGDTASPDAMTRIGSAARAFDNHLYVSSRVNGSNVDVVISRPLAVAGATGRGGVVPLTSAPPPPPPPPAPGTNPDSVRMGAEVQAAKLVTQVKPTYPPLAKAARVQGTVSFQVVIDKDGKIQNLQLLSGPPLLVAAAKDAVAQWVYQPTLMNGNPVSVVTQVDVSFTLTE